MKPQQRLLEELFVLDTLDLRFLARLREQYPRSRCLHWNALSDARQSISLAMSMAKKVVVGDGITPPLAMSHGTVNPTEDQVIALSEFDPQLARHLARLTRSETPTCCEGDSGRLATVARGPVLFCPSNDTHTKLFDPIAHHLDNAHFLLFDRRPEERAREMLESLDIDYIEGGAERLAELRPSVIVVGNDWYDGVWELFERAYALGIPTVCIQEGCLDFTTHRRMQYCDYAFIQGPIMLDHLASPIQFLTGNPRFDAISRPRLPETPVAMLNCNFTYGVEEDARYDWVGAITGACRDIGLDYFISQHPRDKGVFPDDPVRPSHAGVVHDHLAASSILVTRFSTLVYEAMRAGRQVVYYNPHDEQMRLFNEDETGGIYKARDPQGLREALALATRPITTKTAQSHELFLRMHCGEGDGQAAWRSAAALASISLAGSPRSGANLRDWYAMWSQRRMTAIKRRYGIERSRLRGILGRS